MSSFLVYDTTGKILRTGYCPDGMEAVQAHMDNESVIVSPPLTVNGSNSYVVNGTVTAMPPQPDTYHVFDFPSGSWIDQRTLADAQASQWEIVKAARDTANLTGFVWNSMNFQSDSVSQSRIQGAIQLAQLAIAASQPFSIVWTLTDNSTTTLSATQMFSVGVALGTFIQTNYGKGVALRNAINAATSITAVEAIVWN
jgi:hypothetical protein